VRPSGNLTSRQAPMVVLDEGNVFTPPIVPWSSAWACSQRCGL
jgi:hypothetical protein